MHACINTSNLFLGYIQHGDCGEMLFHAYVNANTSHTLECRRSRSSKAFLSSLPYGGSAEVRLTLVQHAKVIQGVQYNAYMRARDRCA